MFDPKWPKPAKPSLPWPKFYKKIDESLLNWPKKSFLYHIKNILKIKLKVLTINFVTPFRVN